MHNQYNAKNNRFEKFYKIILIISRAVKTQMSSKMDQKPF